MNSLSSPYFSVDRSRFAVQVTIALVICMQIELALSKSINWDEFYHFSQIHRFLQERQVQWLQVPFVWIFYWVPSLPGDTISHIQLIRILLIPFVIATLVGIIASARRLAGRDGALVCGLAYITGGYVFLHAFALRADIIAASLLTGALWIGICRPLRTKECLAIGLLFALAFVATIKSVLYAPAFLGVALYRLRRPLHRWTLAISVALLVAAAAYLLWIAPRLSPSGTLGLLRDIGMLGRSSINRMFSAGLFPQSQWLEGQVLRAPLLTIALSLACGSLLIDRTATAMDRVLRLSLLMPLFSVAIYRNAYPYHYAFILPPAVIAMAPTVSALMQPRRQWIAIAATMLLASAIALSLLEDRSVLLRQQTVQEGLNEIFPRPVTYIDSYGVLGDFPRAVNRFASGWALEGYRRRSHPTYSKALQEEPVPLLLANNGVILGALFDLESSGQLLPEDDRSLKDTYIQHWGKAFVAGRRIPTGSDVVAFQVSVPGPYTIEGGGLILDGTFRTENSVVILQRGQHFASGTRQSRITLRWGDHLRKPSYAWPDEPLFTAY